MLMVAADGTRRLPRYAARAHAYRQRILRSAKDPTTTDHVAAKAKLEVRKAVDTTRSAERTAVAREVRGPDEEVRQAELHADQRQRADAIAKARAKYERRKQEEKDAKRERDGVAAVVRRYSHRRVPCSSELPCRHRCCRHGGVLESSRDHVRATQLAYAKAVRARERAGYALRSLPWAPPHLIDIAVTRLRDGPGDIQSSTSLVEATLGAAVEAPELSPEATQGTVRARVIPSLARQAPKLPKKTRAFQFPTYYHRHLNDGVFKDVQVGRKVGPGSVPTPAWQRARVVARLMTDGDPDAPWCCDVARHGCIKPTLGSEEPTPPYAVWCCEECDFCVCEVCRQAGPVDHPHPLQRQPVHV